MPTCTFCEKSGIPILPLRYAIARAGSGAVKTDISDASDIGLNEKAAYYTRRLVRSGYIYLFDEALEIWKCYFATNQSYFCEIDYLPDNELKKQTPSIKIVLPSKPFDCPEKVHKALASCITVRNSPATKIWIGFSDVRWTRGVLDKHADPTYRGKHMRVINVQAPKTGKDASHVLMIAEVEDQVAEYQMTNDGFNNNFKWSLQQRSPRKDEFSTLIKKCNELKPGKAFAVTLSDPVGIVQDLSLLMNHNLNKFIDQPSNIRKVAAYAAIESLQIAIKDESVNNRIIGYVESNEYMINIGNNPAFPDSAAVRQERAARVYRRNPLTDEELTNTASSAWAKYKSKYKFQEVNDWKEQYSKLYKTNDDNLVQPLAKSFTQWMQHKSMTHYFQCNFDPNDLDSGVVYTTVLTMCIAPTGNQHICNELYFKWLKSKDVFDPSNLVLSALNLNNNSLKQAVDDASGSSPDWGSVAWDKVIEAFSRGLNLSDGGKADVLARLIAHLTGPIARTIRLAAKDGFKLKSLVSLAAAAGEPFYHFRIIGTVPDFNKKSIENLLKFGNKTPSNNKVELINKEMQAKLKLYEAQGFDVSAKKQEGVLLMIPKSKARNLPHLSKQELAEYYAKHTYHPEEISLDNINEMKRGLASAYALKVYGIVNVIANFVAFTTINNAGKVSLDYMKSENTLRWWGQVTQVAGAISGSLEQFVKELRLPFFKNSAAILGSFTVLLGRIGLFCSVVGSFFMAGLDFMKGVEEGNNKNSILALGYFTSGFLGMIITFGFAAAAAAALGIITVSASFLAIVSIIGLVLSGLLIMLGIVISLNTDDKIQDWLERCVFGILENDRFKSSHIEMQQLQVALR